MSNSTKLPNIHLGDLHRKTCGPADTALRLAAFLGTTSGFWLDLQADYDTKKPHMNC